jgi:hypothetical protein
LDAATKNAIRDKFEAVTTSITTGSTVPGGGTGGVSFTAYAPIFGGTTSTSALQSGTVGTSGQVLTSNGAGVLPSFQDNAASNIGAQTIWVPAAAMASTVTLGSDYISYVATGASAPDIAFVAFQTSYNPHAQFQIAMPKSWNNGTLTAQFFWATYGTAQEVTDTGGTTNDIYISAATSALTVGGTPATGDMVIFDVYRNSSAGADTIAVSARLIGVKLIYTTNAANDN